MKPLSLLSVLAVLLGFLLLAAAYADRDAPNFVTLAVSGASLLLASIFLAIVGSRR